MPRQRRKPVTKKKVPARSKKVEEEPVSDEEETPDVEETSDVEGEEKPKTRAPRKKVTLDSFLEKIEELLTSLDEEITKKQTQRETGVRTFQTIRKRVRDLKRDAPKISSARRRNVNRGNTKSGFTLKCEITPALHKFMKLKKNENPTRVEITNAICAYVRMKPDEKREQVLRWQVLNPKGKRNLQNPERKMEIQPDAALSKLLNIAQYAEDVKKGNIWRNKVNRETKEKERVKVTEPVIEYWTLQRLVQPHIISTISEEKPVVAASSSSSGGGGG